MAADPLLDLLLAGGPTLAWILRWSPDGADPLPAAWTACEDAGLMVRVLGFAGRMNPQTVVQLLGQDVRPWQFAPSGGAPYVPRRDPVLAVAVRRAFPRGPTLDEILQRPSSHDGRGR